MDTPSPMDAAYEIAKAHAVTDGAYSEPLMRHWFAAAWDLCAQAVGFVYPGRQVTESVTPHRDGTVQLSGRPTSEVRLYSNGVLVAVLPPDAPELSGHRALRNPFARYSDDDDCYWCSPALCCLSGCVQASYRIGESNVCEISPAFVQAVAQLFAFMVENRGDVKLDDQVLSRSGAKGWLSGGMTYIA
jgi:hypothetical protein